MRYFVFCFCLIIAGCNQPSSKNLESASELQWVHLFNGENLEGWHQLNGEAKYEVVQDQIVGTAIPKSPNSFLATDKLYSDFILELELWADSPINSGIQFRSLSQDDYLGGRVHGYQMEVDPSDRAWSGGIYDEGRRGWLYPLTKNTKAQSAYKKDDWNKYRIEAIGNEIRTFVNGVPCARLFDDVTSEGFIALQVHGIGSNEELIGKQIKWRNIKILTNDLEEAQLDAAFAPSTSFLVNRLSNAEIDEGWELLWDGKTGAGWTGYGKDQFPSEWEIEDGVLSVQETGSYGKGGGDIHTVEKFSSFELELDFNFAKGANSGIKYFVDTNLNKSFGAIGLEYQILDDRRHPDANQGKDGNRKLAGLYDLIPADELGKQRFSAPEAWHKARIVVNGNSVQHWLDDVPMLSYERGSEEFRELVAGSKYKKFKNFGEAQEGHLLLQDHGNEVQFRSIKIRKL